MFVPPIIDLRRVTVIKQGNRILSEIDWQVGAGERWLLTGPNGAGKTTLLQVVSTYQFPTWGQAFILGEQMGRTDVRRLRPRIGYVGIAPASLVRRHLPVRVVVVTGRHASFVDARWTKPTDQDWENAYQHLDTMGMAEMADREFATLSEGEMKRVLIARALMTQPDLLLLDEPGSGLDLGARERLIHSLSAVAHSQNAGSVVLVTHHVEEIPPGFKQTLVLEQGKAVASGPTRDVLTGEMLSRVYDWPIRVETRQGRFYAAGRMPGNEGSV